MLEFQTLKVDAENQRLIIEVKVKDDPNYANVYLTKLIIGNQNQFSPINITFKNPKEILIPKGRKRWTEILNLIDLLPDWNLDTDLFFVQAITEDSPEPEASKSPCGEDNQYVLGVAFNKGLIYKKGLCFAQDFKPCEQNDAFIDYILQCNTFKMAINSGNFDVAIEYWNRLSNNYQSSTIKTCCNG